MGSDDSYEKILKDNLKHLKKGSFAYEATKNQIKTIEANKQGKTYQAYKVKPVKPKKVKYPSKSKHTVIYYEDNGKQVRKLTPYETAAAEKSSSSVPKSSQEKPEVLQKIRQQQNTKKIYYEDNGKQVRKLRPYETAAVEKYENKNKDYTPVRYTPKGDSATIAPPKSNIVKNYQKSQTYKIKAMREKSKTKKVEYNIISDYYGAQYSAGLAGKSIKRAVKERGVTNFVVGASFGLASAIAPKPVSTALKVALGGLAMYYTPYSIVKATNMYVEKGYTPFNSLLMATSSGGADVATSASGFVAGSAAGTGVKMGASYAVSQAKSYIYTKKYAGKSISAVKPSIIQENKVYATELRGIKRTTYGVAQKGSKYQIQVDIPIKGKTYVVEESAESPFYVAKYQKKGIAGIIPESQSKAYANNLPSQEKGIIFNYKKTHMSIPFKPDEGLLKNKFSVFIGNSGIESGKKAFYFEQGKISFSEAPKQNNFFYSKGGGKEAPGIQPKRIDYYQRKQISYTPKLPKQYKPLQLGGWIKEGAYKTNDRVGIIVRDVETNEISEYTFKNPLVVSKVVKPFKSYNPIKTTTSAGDLGAASSSGLVSKVILEKPKLKKETKQKQKTKQTYTQKQEYNPISGQKSQKIISIKTETSQRQKQEYMRVKTKMKTSQSTKSTKSTVRTIKILKPKFKAIYSSKTNTRAKNTGKIKTMYVTKPKPKKRTISILKTGQDIDTGQISILKTGQDTDIIGSSIYKFKIGYDYNTPSNFDTTPNQTPRPPTKPSFGFGFGFHWDGKGRNKKEKKTIKIRQGKYEYKPTITSSLFNIVGKEKPKQTKTGLTIRPLIKPKRKKLFNFKL